MCLSKRHAGFTLIEMMVVVLVVGIMLGVSTLAMRSDAVKVLKSESHQLARQIELARQDGAMRQHRVALKVDRLGWMFLQISPMGLKPLTQAALRGKSWSVPLTSVTSQQHREDAGSGLIYLDHEPVGGPFDLVLTQEPHSVLVSRNERGQLVVSQLN